MSDASDVLALDAALVTQTGTPGFGVTADGFVPKPYGRLIAEKIALAQALIGPDVDVTTGSPLRTLLEISALEDARGWAALAATYDDLFVVSARGVALSRLGDELGLARPSLEATGSVTLTASGPLPGGQLAIPRGTRMTTPGGHHVALDGDVLLSAAKTAAVVPVVAFYPGPSHDLDPAVTVGTVHPQRIDTWNADDAKLPAALAANPALVTIAHTAKLSGGELFWDDVRYRRLLLQAPRSLWTADAVRLAASLVPGVRQVVVRDVEGGLDLQQSVFGDFAFVERLFASARDFGSPYTFTVLVALTANAIWDGPDNVDAQVGAAIEDIRPIGIFPKIVRATEIGVAVEGQLVVRGLPIPFGTPDAVNASAAALDLKQRLYDRFAKYVEALAFGEPVRAAEVTWAIMNEPGIADVQNLRLVRYPPAGVGLRFEIAAMLRNPQAVGANVQPQADEIAVPVRDDGALRIV